MSGYMNKKHSRYPLIAKIGTALQVTEKCYTPHGLHPHLSCIGQTAGVCSLVGRDTKTGGDTR